MRIYGPSGSRNAPIDRNPARLGLGNVIAQAGGGSTILVTYTVPAGRRAFVTLWGTGDVTTALAAGQIGQVQFAVSGQTLNPDLLWDALSAVGTFKSLVVPGIFVAAGDGVSLTVTLGAGAGVLRATGGLNGYEYDA